MSLFRFLGSKFCDLCLLYICCISIMQSDSRRIVGTLCLKCNKRFNSTFAYQQHRRSWRLRATACYSLDEQGSELVASRRPNLSTAALHAGMLRRQCKDLHICSKFSKIRCCIDIPISRRRPSKPGPQQLHFTTCFL